MIWLAIFFAWLGFVLWMAVHPQGQAFRDEWWSWLNPWDFSQGIVDGNAMREEERQQEVMKEQAERAAAHQAEMIERDRERRSSLITGQPDFSSFIPQSRPGMQIQTHNDIKTNERKFRVVDRDSNQMVEATVRQEELANCKTPQEQSMLVQRKIEEAMRVLNQNPVLGEVSGGVSVTPEEYEEKFLQSGKPMSPEDALVQEILGASPEDYKEDAEFETGH